MKDNWNELLRVRYQKMAELKSVGIDPFGEKYNTSHYSNDIINEFDDLDGRQVSVDGRWVSKRIHGKAIFANREDQGGQIEIYFRQDGLAEEIYRLLDRIDSGD